MMAVVAVAVGGGGGVGVQIVENGRVKGGLGCGGQGRAEIR
jgi:hypothetical protein